MKEIMEQLQQLYSNNKKLDEWEQLGYAIIERELLDEMVKKLTEKMI